MEPHALFVTLVLGAFIGLSATAVHVQGNSICQTMP